MKDSNQADELIGRVFTSLRDVQAPEGLEARILRSVDNHAAEPARRKAAGWPRGLEWAGGLAVVTAGVLIALFVLTRATTHAPRNAFAVQQDVANAQHSRAARLPDFAQGDMATNEASKRMIAAHEEHAGNHHAVHGSTETRSALRDIAVEEAEAPSKPAPPLPLTAGETLLQQSARRGHPKIDSPLNPEVRARERLQAASEFTNFFTPPPVKAGNE